MPCAAGICRECCLTCTGKKQKRDVAGYRPHCFAPWFRSGFKLLLQQQFRGSSDEPSPLVNIEFYQAFVSHFQQEGLAGFLIRDIGAFHDLVDFERLLAERAQDILSIIQHDYSLQTSKS
jgi:hypothetical protein